MRGPNIIVIDEDHQKFQILDKPEKAVKAAKIATVMEEGESAEILRHLQEAEEEEEKAEDQAQKLYEEGKSPEEIESAIEIDEAKIDKANKSFRSVCERVAAVNDKLWHCEAMHASEYERGGFTAHVASRLIDSSPPVATVISVDVNTNILPNKEEQRVIKDLYKKEVKTLRDSFAEAGITIPETIPTKVYIVAPQERLTDAVSMVKAFAAQSEESMTHRGLSFNDAVACQSLSRGDKSKIDKPQRVGWYEIDAGIFFTIDKAMFDRVKVAFVAQKPKPSVSQPSM
jgi:hypothetical protein